MWGICSWRAPWPRQPWGCSGRPFRWPPARKGAHGCRRLSTTFAGCVRHSGRRGPGQEPGRCYELFEKHVKKRLPDAEVIRDHAAMPYKVPDEDLDKVSLIQDAMEYSFGSRPVMVAEGGSIGAVLTMREELGVPVLFLPLSLPQDSYHGPDESFAWSMVPGGVKAFLRFFELVGSAAE